MPLSTSPRVRLARLDAQFYPDTGITRHGYDCTIPSGGIVRREAEWKRRVQPLGSGGFGTVYLEECIAGEEAGELRAVKTIRKPTLKNGKVPDYDRELEAIAMFSSQEYERCFVSSLGWYETIDLICIAMDYFPHGDLHNYLESPLPEIEGKRIVSQVLEGLEYMHEQGYAHRDLKPANLMVVHKGPLWWVKISDFGVSKRVAQEITSLRTQIGTPAFVAPEVMGIGDDDDSSDDETRQSYTNAVDLWAVGVISFLLVTGQLPFSEPRHLSRYVKGKTPFPTELMSTHGVGSSGCAMVKSLMAPKPGNRPSAKNSRHHSWLKGFDDHRPGGASSTISLEEVTQATASWGFLDSGYQSTAQHSLRQNDSSAKAPNSFSSNTKTDVLSAALAHTDYSWKGTVALRGHNARIWQLRFSAAGTLFASAAGDMTIGVWNVAHGKRHRSLTGHRGEVLTVAFSPDSALLASGSRDNTVMIWDIHKGEVKFTLHGHRSPVCVVAVSANGKLVASGSWDNTVRLWSAVTGTSVSTLQGHTDSVRTLAFSPDSKLVVSGSSDRTLITWKIDEEAVVQKAISHGDEVVEVAFSPHGQHLASVSRDGVLSLWHMPTMNLVHKFKDQAPWSGSVVFSPDGNYIASISARQQSALLRDITTGLVYHTIFGGNRGRDRVSSLVFSPDGGALALASKRRIRLVDTGTGGLLSTLEGHTDGWVKHLVFSPDGKAVASASEDFTVWIWQHGA